MFGSEIGRDIPIGLRKGGVSRGIGPWVKIGQRTHVLVGHTVRNISGIGRIERLDRAGILGYHITRISRRDRIALVLI